MGLLDFLRSTDINAGVEQWKNSEHGVLIDVRTPGEYNSGHIPGSINIPLDKIRLITTRIYQKDTPLFVHCLSGSRSRQATAIIQQLGYTNVHNIGGISSYRGKIEE